MGVNYQGEEEDKSVRAEKILSDGIRMCFQKTEKQKLDLGFSLRILVYVNICISFSPLDGT